MEHKLKVIYIAGCTHCGSTLMNRVLGAHPKAITLGSTKKLPVILKKKTPCCCGAPSLFDCPFWGRVHEALRERGMGLDTIDFAASGAVHFAKDNRALYQAVLDVAGADVVIESSRRSSRLKRLRAVPSFAVTTVHLYKTPRCQGSSWQRKGKWLPRWAADYLTRNLRILAACRHDPSTLLMSYEQFCRHPELELRRMFSAVGLANDERTLGEVLAKWGESPIHTLGGNRMKGSTSSAIHLDESWRERLSPRQVRLMDLACGGLWRRMESLREKSATAGGHVGDSAGVAGRASGVGSHGICPPTESV